MTYSGWQAADRPGRPVLFVNPNSGGGKATRAGLAERARDRGIDVVVVRPARPSQRWSMRQWRAARTRSESPAATAHLPSSQQPPLAHGLPFICVPAGTRNHFALDLGLDRHDLVGSLDAFTDGVERRIDVAEVNGRLFLNNVSLGIYGDAVRQPTYRDAKARTLLRDGRARARAERRRGRPATRGQAGPSAPQPGGRARLEQPLLARTPAAPGTRPRLDSGQLGVIVLDTPRAGRSPGRTWTATRLEVTAPAPVHAGIDGEAVDLIPPLRFAIRSGALRVRISSRDATV